MRHWEARFPVLAMTRSPPHTAERTVKCPRKKSGERLARNCWPIACEKKRAEVRRPMESGCHWLHR